MFFVGKIISNRNPSILLNVQIHLLRDKIANIYENFYGRVSKQVPSALVIFWAKIGRYWNVHWSKKNCISNGKDLQIFQFRSSSPFQQV